MKGSYCSLCGLRGAIATPVYATLDGGSEGRSLCLTCLKGGGSAGASGPPSGESCGTGAACASPPALSTPSNSAASTCTAVRAEHGVESSSAPPSPRTAEQRSGGVLVLPHFGANCGTSLTGRSLPYEPTPEQEASYSRLHDDAMLYARAQCLREERQQRTARSNQLLLEERALLWRAEQAVKRAAAGLAGASGGGGGHAASPAGGRPTPLVHKQQHLHMCDAQEAQAAAAPAGAAAARAHTEGGGEEAQIAAFVALFVRKFGEGKQAGLERLVRERQGELLQAIALPGEAQQVLAVRQLLKEQ